MSTPIAVLPSIRTRLARTVLLIAAAWGLLLALTVGTVLHRSLDRLLDAGLQESAELVYGVLSMSQGQALPDDGSLPAPPHREGLVWQVVRPNGGVGLRSHSAPVQPLTLSRESGFSHTSDWHLYTLPLPDQQGVLHVAQPDLARTHAQRSVLGASMGVALIIGLLSAWWLNARLRAELQPLNRLSLSVTRFDPLHTEARLPAADRAELLPLQEALDDLGQRLHARVAHERAFAAHAAHALRTPLAGLDAQLAVAIKEADEARQPRLRQIRAAAAKLRSVVSALISLFRAGGEVHWQPVELADLLARMPVKGVAVRVSGPSVVHADPDLLAAAMLNLLDNAARHQATEVLVQIQSEGAGVRLAVQDNGTGWSADRLAQVQQALASGQGEGVLGLGLTLVDLVARKHGGVATVSAGAAGDTFGQGSIVSMTIAPAPSEA